MNYIFFGVKHYKWMKNLIIFITDCRNNGLMIYADNKKSYNKFSQCPLVLPLPTSDEQQDYLYKKLKWLSTKNGYNASNTFDYDKWIQEYPDRMEINEMDARK